MLMTKKLSVAAMAAPLLTAVALAMPAISVAQAPVPVAPSVRGLPDFTDLAEQVRPALLNIRPVERAVARPALGRRPHEESDAEAGRRHPIGMEPEHRRADQ